MQWDLLTARVYILLSTLAWQLCCSLGPACNVNCMSCFWSPRGPPQATGTCDLYRCWVSGWTSSSSLMCYKIVSEFSMKFDLHSTWSQLIDSTTEQASEFSVSFQLDLYLNQQANMVYAPSSIYITQQFVHSSYGQCIAICLHLPRMARKGMLCYR